MPDFDKDMFENWWGNDDENYEKEPRETIWLDSPEDDDEYEVMNAEDDSKASHCPITMIKQKISKFIEDHKDFIDSAINMYLGFHRAYDMSIMTASLGASNFISFQHQELCKDAPVLTDPDSFNEENPLQNYLCTPNATIAINYIAYAAAIPAWDAHKDFKNTSWFLGDELYEEHANELVSDVQGYAGYTRYAAAFSN